MPGGIRRFSVRVWQNHHDGAEKPNAQRFTSVQEGKGSCGELKFSSLLKECATLGWHYSNPHFSAIHA